MKPSARTASILLALLIVAGVVAVKVMRSRAEFWSLEHPGYIQCDVCSADQELYCRNNLWPGRNFAASPLSNQEYMRQQECTWSRVQAQCSETCCQAYIDGFGPESEYNTCAYCAPGQVNPQCPPDPCATAGQSCGPGVNDCCLNQGIQCDIASGQSQGTCTSCNGQACQGAGTTAGCCSGAKCAVPGQGNNVNGTCSDQCFAQDIRCNANADCCSNSCINNVCTADACLSQKAIPLPACDAPLGAPVAPPAPTPSPEFWGCGIAKNSCYAYDSSMTSCQVLDSPVQECEAGLNCVNNTCIDPCINQKQTMQQCNTFNGVPFAPVPAPALIGESCTSKNECYWPVTQNGTTTCTVITETQDCEGGASCGIVSGICEGSSSSSSSQPMCCNLQTRACEPM